MKTITYLCIIVFVLSLLGCASMQAKKELDTLPENFSRGDPLNTDRVREFLQIVLDSPAQYEIKAYHRKAYSTETKKSLFMTHYFYVFFYDGSMIHTLVYTGTPSGSERDGSWMLDADTDVESFKLYEASGNPWEVVEYSGPNGESKLNTVLTAQNILNRLLKNYTFFGASIVRTMAWYHQLWMFLVPPPIIGYGPLLLATINRDSCASAVIETVAWERN